MRQEKDLIVPEFLNGTPQRRRFCVKTFQEAHSFPTWRTLGTRSISGGLSFHTESPIQHSHDQFPPTPTTETDIPLEIQTRSQDNPEAPVFAGTTNTGERHTSVAFSDSGACGSWLGRKGSALVRAPASHGPQRRAETTLQDETHGEDQR